MPVITPAAAAVELPLPRHVEPIRANAARAGFKLIGEFYDSAGRVKDGSPPTADRGRDQPNNRNGSDGGFRLARTLSP